MTGDAPATELSPDARRVMAILEEVPDPEVPVLSVVELGIVRDVVVDDAGAVTVQVTPTYSGCPAMRAIEDDIVAALRAHGFARVSVQTTYTPAWTTDWPVARAARAARAQRSDGAVPLLRLARHRTPERVRVDGVQGDPLLPQLQTAVRGVQGDLRLGAMRRRASRDSNAATELLTADTAAETGGNGTGELRE